MNTKTIIQKIVNVFETGKEEGNYGGVTVLRGDTGGLSFGKQQVTLMSGNLFKLLDLYIENGGKESNQLRLFMPLFNDRDKSLNDNEAVKGILRQTASDPIMIKTQDDFFDAGYWIPAFNRFKSMEFTLPLSNAIIYDSFIQGAFSIINNNITHNDEYEWMSNYVKLRRDWLLSKGQPLSNTVYRMDTFLKLIADKNWQLELPIQVHGVIIRDDQTSTTAIKVPFTRVLKTGCRGQDVEAVQAMLGKKGFDVGVADGIFGQDTENAVKAFQEKEDLQVDGTVGPNTLHYLFDI